jgi:hypothetical protein
MTKASHETIGHSGAELFERSERLLKKILVGIYDQDDAPIKYSDYTLEEIYTQTNVGDVLGMAPKDFCTSSRKGIEVRPVYDGKRGNTLGRIHDSVMLMCEKDHPEFRAYAVCLANAKLTSAWPLFGKLFSEPGGGKAIILNLQLFGTLYVINQLYYVAASDKSIDLERKGECLTNMFCLFSQDFGYRTFRPSRQFIEPRNREELEISHYLTNCQQQFVLLHEFGHIAISHQERATHPEATKVKPSLDDEMAADEWAARKLSEHRNRFYDLFVQLRSILWLFDLMHFVEVMEQGGKADQSVARKRFDSIRATADPQGEVFPSKEIYEIRQIVDLMILHWDQHYSNLRRNKT